MALNELQVTFVQYMREIIDLGHVHVGIRGNEMQVTQLCKGYLSTELLKVFFIANPRDCRSGEHHSGSVTLR